MKHVVLSVADTGVDDYERELDKSEVGMFRLATTGQDTSSQNLKGLHSNVKNDRDFWESKVKEAQENQATSSVTKCTKFTGSIK